MQVVPHGTGAAGLVQLAKPEGVAQEVMVVSEKSNWAMPGSVLSRRNRYSICSRAQVGLVRVQPQAGNLQHGWAAPSVAGPRQHRRTSDTS